MGPVLLIACSIVIATVMVLLNEKKLHRSVREFPPQSPPGYRSSIRNYPKGRDTGQFSFDQEWKNDARFDELRLRKKQMQSSNESNRLMATLLFVAALIGLFYLLSN